MVALWISLFAFPGTTDWWTNRDNSLLGWFVDIRTGTLTSIADVVAVLGSSWFLRVLRMGPSVHSSSCVASDPAASEGRGRPRSVRFRKLYSQVHLRSDRWYKIGRTILYGSLEDELRFSSVRRVVEYEDYIQRVKRDAGVSSAEPFGIVEITPEREYLTVSQFLPRSQELTDAEIDEKVIDDALGLIRSM